MPDTDITMFSLFTMEEFATQLLGKVFCSTHADAESDSAALTEASISHILCLGKRPKWLKQVASTISKVYFDTPKRPVINGRWIAKFSDINCILTEAIAQGGAWIIGVPATAKLITAAYVISTNNVSVTEAISCSPEMTRISIPEAFCIQLKLWKAMDGHLDSKFAPYTAFIEKESKLAIPKGGSRARFQPDIAAGCIKRISSAQERYKG